MNFANEHVPTFVCDFLMEIMRCTIFIKQEEFSCDK